MPAAPRSEKKQEQVWNLAFGKLRQEDYKLQDSIGSTELHSETPFQENKTRIGEMTPWIMSSVCKQGPEFNICKTILKKIKNKGSAKALASEPEALNQIAGT